MVISNKELKWKQSKEDKKVQESDMIYNSLLVLISTQCPFLTLWTLTELLHHNITFSNNIFFLKPLRCIYHKCKIYFLTLWGLRQQLSLAHPGKLLTWAAIYFLIVSSTIFIQTSNRKSKNEEKQRTDDICDIWTVCGNLKGKK